MHLTIEINAQWYKVSAVTFMKPISVSQLSREDRCHANSSGIILLSSLWTLGEGEICQTKYQIAGTGLD